MPFNHGQERIMLGYWLSMVMRNFFLWYKCNRAAVVNRIAITSNMHDLIMASVCLLLDC